MSHSIKGSLFSKNSHLDDDGAKTAPQGLKMSVPHLRPATPPESGTSAASAAPIKRSSQPMNTEPAKSSTPPMSKDTKKVVLPKDINVSLKINPELTDLMKEAAEFLDKSKLTAYSDEIKALTSQTNRHRFTVAVVGEFSRGKSTFINNLFGKDMLPVANMPTTAMLTRIRYSEKESITIVDTSKKQKKTLPLCQESWDQYIADDEGNDPQGVAFVGVNSPWLKNGIEVIDTPGAGDLEAKRAKLIGDALTSSDSAIITISAETAMSLSEKLFIEERLISKKTPFLMLIITKLDRIDVRERSSIIRFVKEKLKSWMLEDIPVYVPYNMEMPDDTYSSVMGMDKVINQINQWISCSERKALTEKWLAMKTVSILGSASDFVKEKKYLLNAESDEKRQQMIEQKEDLIQKADSVWEDTKVKMLKKGSECYELFLNRASEYIQSITEKLQYEVAHTGNVQKWWNEDYPYRLKIEMTNMSSSMESVVSRQINKDSTWFNSVLEKSFKTSVIVPMDEIADREAYTNFKIERDVTIKDMSKERAISRIGITVLSITTALACSAIGVASIIGTMGVGTGGSLISEGIFKKKTEEQREIIKAEIQKNIPKVVSDAMSHSEGRIKNMYSELVAEASKQQEIWMEKQRAVVSSASSASEDKSSPQLDSLLADISAMSAKFEDHI